MQNHSLDNLKHYHTEAIQFLGAELTLLKEVIPKITDEHLTKPAILLISCGQTGAALLQLANQIDIFSSELTMLSRSFMEKIVNFCYLGICDEKEYRAFILHPIYKHYHNVEAFKMDDDLELATELFAERKKKQEDLKELPLVKEALAMFSETKSNLNWTKKNLSQRIEAIEKWGKVLDVFFRLSKIHYYSDASEALHGSLYGCMFDIGAFEDDFGRDEGLEKKLYKDSACILLHLGMLIHEAFTLISYSNDIKEIWDYSYKNRNQALNLFFHVLGRKIKPLKIS